jgi:calmodulin
MLEKVKIVCGQGYGQGESPYTFDLGLDITIGMVSIVIDIGMISIAIATINRRTQNKPQRKPLHIVCLMPLTEQEITDFKQAFQIFDTNNDGLISTNDLGIGLRNIGQNPTEAELQQMVQDLSKNENGMISFEELLASIQVNDTLETREKEIFKILDRKEQGFLTVEDLRHMIKSSGLDISEQEIELMFREADIDGDEKISFQEFQAIKV